MGERETLTGFIARNISSIRRRWHGSVLASYPPETAKLLGSGKGQFSNPVGHTLNAAIDDVLEGLRSGAPIPDIAPALHNLIRIKAVQGFTPSDAVSIVLMLKHAVRDELARSPHEFQGAEGTILNELDPMIDELLCSCFDLYVECRQKLSEIKEEELKRNLYMLLKKADMVDSSGQGDGR